jgi:hypothetical protein
MTTVDLTDILTKYVLPSVLGGIGGLVATYFNWGIEKKKQRLQRKRELVTGWRMELIPLIGQPNDPAIIRAGERQRKVMSSPYYASLRPHLSSQAITEIENGTVRVFVHTGGPRINDWNHHFPLKIFVEEIARIEREWKLV